jgi:hypothetical protein
MIKINLEKDFNTICSVPTIFRQIKDFNYTFKTVTRVIDISNDDVTLDLRKDYAQQFLEMLPQKDGENILFIDEVGFNASMRCKRGRTP